MKFYLRTTFAEKITNATSVHMIAADKNKKRTEDGLKILCKMEKTKGEMNWPV